MQSHLHSVTSQADVHVLGLWEEELGTETQGEQCKTLHLKPFYQLTVAVKDPATLPPMKHAPLLLGHGDIQLVE